MLHPVHVTWLAETQEIAVDRHGRTVLQVKAKRDAEICHFHVRFPKVPHGIVISIMAAEQVPATGAKRVYLQTMGGVEPVMVLRDLNGTYARITSPLLGPEGIVHDGTQGDDHWWTWAGSISLPKGKAVGLIVSTSEPTRCIAKVGGR